MSVNKEHLFMFVVLLVIKNKQCDALITCRRSELIDTLVECKSTSQFNFFNLQSLENVSPNPIETLIAKGCGIYKLDQRIFATRKTITHLDLSDNYLKDTNAISPLNLLADLDISGNTFFSPTPQRIVANHPRLIRLAIGRNPFDVLHWKIFFWSIVLLRLDISSCDISDLPQRLFEKPTRLQEIIVSKNNIATLHQNIFNTLPNLKSIDLSDNKLRSLPDNLFKRNTLLEKVDLSRNIFNVIDATTFKTTPKLNCLFLSQNQLSTTLWGAIQGLHELEELRVDGNQIDEVITISGSFPNLKHLTLACNGLGNIPLDFFEGYPKLKELSLYGNPWKCSCFRHIWTEVDTKEIRVLANPKINDSLPACVIVDDERICDSSNMDRGLWKSWFENGGNRACDVLEESEEVHFIE